MENPFILALLGNIAIALIIISFVFLVGKIKHRVLGKVDKLVALSVGLILGIIFLGFIPEIFDHGNIEAQTAGVLILTGIFIFYVLELFLHWHHCKDLGPDGHSHHDHEHKNSPLIAAGTFFHNLVHGVILFSAFSIDSTFGVATTLAVLMHAVPQNVANLLMNHNDTTFVYIAAGGGVLGALLIYPFQDLLLMYNFHILALIAGGLLYTAMSDILPSFTKKQELSQKSLYLGLMISGILAFSGVQALQGEHSHEHDHNNHEYETTLGVAEESASLADGIYVDQSDHFKNGEEHEPEAKEEHEGENHNEHEGHDHD